MERIDAKCSGITKTDPECPSGVEIAILVLLERYHGNSGFSFVCINWEGAQVHGTAQHKASRRDEQWKQSRAVLNPTQWISIVDFTCHLHGIPSSTVTVAPDHHLHLPNLHACPIYFIRIFILSPTINTCHATKCCIYNRFTL